MEAELDTGNEGREGIKDKCYKHSASYHFNIHEMKKYL